jgi:hypothetical protein
MTSLGNGGPSEYDPAQWLGKWGYFRDTGRELLCPECEAREAAYVHWEPAVTHETDGYTSPTGERGSWLDVPMRCENGHHFHLVLAFHKGFTFVHLVAGGPSYRTEPL